MTKKRKKKKKSGVLKTPGKKQVTEADLVLSALSCIDFNMRRKAPVKVFSSCGQRKDGRTIMYIIVFCSVLRCALLGGERADDEGLQASLRYPHASARRKLHCTL